MTFFNCTRYGNPTGQLLLVVVAVLLAACEPAPETTEPELSRRHVERIENLAFDDGVHNSRFDAVYVDDQLRVVTERFDNQGIEARNLYLYFEGEPVFYRSQGNWQADGTTHHINAWAEFAINGHPIGLDKRLDNQPLPVPPDEALAIRERARALHQLAEDAQRPDGCDFNKTLRAGETMVTVIVPVGQACDAGLLQLYAQTAKGSSMHEFDRKRPVHGAWLHDFDSDGTAEILVVSHRDGNDHLRGWRIDDGRFQEISFGELTPAQQAGFGGRNRYRVEGDRLLRRYSSTSPDRGRVRLTYNWETQRWLAETAPSRDTLQTRIEGVWTGLGNGGSALRIPPVGALQLVQECGELAYPALALPGGLLHISAPLEAPDACDGAQLALQPGAWLAEKSNGSLRLTGLTVDRRHELEASPAREKPAADGSTGD